MIALTALLSLLYAIQYALGGPLRLSVVSPFYDLDLSPDGTRVTAGAQDGLVRVWELPAELRTRVSAQFDVAAETPWPVSTLAGHSGSVLVTGFTPDGTALVSASSGGDLIIWDATSGQVRNRFMIGGAPLGDAALSGDRSALAILTADGGVRVVSVATGQELQSWPPPTAQGPRRVVALNADGTQLAAGAGPNIQVWHVVTGEALQELVGYWEDPQTQTQWLGHDKDVTALAFSPDGRTLASGSVDTTIMFWDLVTAKVLWPAEGHWATVTAMTFGQDGDFLLTGGRDNKIRNLKSAGGKSTASYEGHLSAVNGTSFGPTPDVIFSAGADGTLRAWETANQRTIHIEWSQYGLQPIWGLVLTVWLIGSGLLALVCLWGMWHLRTWSHLLALALFLLGPIVVLGLPLLEVLSYPLTLSTKLMIAWPLIVLAGWYVLLLALLMREPVAVLYEAPRGASLSEQLVISQRTVKTRFGIYGLAVWIALLVILYSVLRRFNLDLAFMAHFLPFIMAGAGLTVVVSAASIALAVVLALLGALGRLSNNPIANGISSFYISLIRGTPLLVQIFIWYLGLPRLNVILQPLVAGILALGVNYGAYMTEIFRAGIQAIGKGQHEAAQALGMTRGQTFRRIVMPQAFRIVIPPIGNEFIAMMKDSSLVYVMGVWELTFRAQKIGRQNFRNMETFLIAAAFYWILTVAFQFLQGKLEEHMARGERR
jgi:polar amino acid transport system permease protein